MTWLVSWNGCDLGLACNWAACKKWDEALAEPKAQGKGTGSPPIGSGECNSQGEAMFRVALEVAAACQ